MRVVLYGFWLCFIRTCVSQFVFIVISCWPVQRHLFVAIVKLMPCIVFSWLLQTPTDNSICRNSSATRSCFHSLAKATNIDTISENFGLDLAFIARSKNASKTKKT